jgi:predicted transcriptional regulator
MTTTLPRPRLKNLLGLGPLEAAIMAVAWHPGHGWLTIPTIRDWLDYPPVSYTTVATVVAVLHRKRLLVRSRTGTSRWKHQAARPLDEHIGHLIAALLDTAPDSGAALACALRHPVPTTPGQPPPAPARADVPVPGGALTGVPRPAGHGRDAS